MYNAQPKLTLDSLLGGMLLIGGVSWTVMTMAFMPAPAAPAGPSDAQQSQLMATAPRPASTGEGTRFPASEVDVIVDKKYA